VNVDHRAEVALRLWPGSSFRKSVVVTDLVLSQLGDLFRIGLIVALVVTMRRTAAVTGRVVPLALGVVFVAVMLPATMPNASSSSVDAILAGLVSNSIILAVVLACAEVIARMRR
jgi:hypothetical protein